MPQRLGDESLREFVRTGRRLISNIRPFHSPLVCARGVRTNACKTGLPAGSGHLLRRARDPHIDEIATDPTYIVYACLPELDELALTTGRALVRLGKMCNGTDEK